MARSVIKRSKKAQTLRANGFRPLPMLWVKEDQFLRILEIASECKPEYDRLCDIHTRRALTREEEIEAAWNSLK